MLPELPIDTLVSFPFLAACLAVLLAYIVFSMVGFGTALIAAPLLAQFLPLTQVIPLLALLDLLASALGQRQGDTRPNRSELQRLLPAMLAGIGIGTALLLAAPAQWLLAGLGVFALSQGIRGLRPQAIQPRASAWQAISYGVSGGIFGALFGSGGFLYALYLGRRLETPAEIRATQASMILASTCLRSGGFLIGGLYGDMRLLLWFAALIPAMLVGQRIGKAVAGRLPRARFLQVLHGMLLLSGTALLLRAWQTSFQ